MANTFHEKPKYAVMMDHDNNLKKVKNFMILLYYLKKCKNTNLSACNYGHLGCQDFLVFIQVNGLMYICPENNFLNNARILSIGRI